MNKLTILAGMLILLASCYNDKADKLYPAPPVNPCDTTGRTVSFSANVRPIMMGNCATSPGCHASGTSTAYDFTSYAGAQLAASNNKLVLAITHQPGASPMPQGMPKLSNCAIAQITKWVKQGAPNN
jgi:hypothetical protein